MEELIQYLKDNKISFRQTSKSVVEIDDKTYQYIHPDEDGYLFDETLEMTCEDTIEDNYVFCFAGVWYWTPQGTEIKPQFNHLKYIGKANLGFEPIPWLGIRGKYEILNGSRDYKDWCKKAKFFGVNVLGICEKNTLAGTLQFQEECKTNDIKSIIGATYTVFDQKDDHRYDVKVYTKNYDGWQTILRINRAVLVDNNGFISEEQFKSLKTSDIYVVTDPKSLSFDKINIDFDFYQYDSVQYNTSQTDISYLNNLKKYILSDYKPILIQDSFYLDKGDAHIKQKLNSISGNRELTSENQYFKSFDDIFDEFDELFDEEDERFEQILESAKKNLLKVVDECNFQIEVGKFSLPEYELTIEQKKVYKNKKDLFDSLINDGINNKVKKAGLDIDLYLKRLHRELELINSGENLVDYFLTLWDIIKWCDDNNILVGVGRGSSGGCLVAYLLNIIRIDPIEYNLLFERFLNENRIKKSLPDIDSDFEGLRRDDIKNYMEQRFGKDSVCSVGTYANMKIKVIISDLAKQRSVDYSYVKLITAISDDMESKGTKYDDVFYLASKSHRFKKFMNENPEIFIDIPYLLMQPRSCSVHACATIITPSNKSIYEWFPVKLMQNKNNESIIVSEWEGFYLDKAGFLKEDILGILQLDKFASILKLVKENKNKDIDIYSLPKQDKKVYRYFHKGWNEDVFQFGTEGLKKYSKEVKPDSIEELTAMNALYRPGAMKSNAHIDYVMIKFGVKEPVYDFGLENVTKNTYGLYLYQEQIMLAAQKLGGFTLSEADMLRKVMLNSAGKKQEKDKFYIYMDKFIDGAVKNGCDKEEAKSIWDKLEAFSGYGFNKSHAVAYAVTGYISQWLKVHYPLEFWVTAFSFVPEGKKDVKIPAYISEIHQTGDIQLKPVDINKSKDGFTADFENNSIYWSLNSVKQCGEKAVEQLVNDKQNKGEYFDFGEFMSRNVHKGSKVTKQIIENLVLSGAFDEIENISQPKNRKDLIDRYRELHKIKIDKTKDIFTLNEDSLQYNWWWSMMQKRVSGFALFDYKLICDNFLDSKNPYCDDLKEYDKAYIKTAGYINEIVVRNTQKGEYADVVLDNNFEFIIVKFWYDQWDKVKQLIDQKEKCILCITGRVQFDKYKDKHILVANDDSEILILE